MLNEEICRARQKLDESIIGGVKVAVGDTVYDGTIQTQLKQIF